jgi:hypothetical protein
MNGSKLTPLEEYNKNIESIVKRHDGISPSKFKKVKYRENDVWFYEHPVGGRENPTYGLSLAAEKLTLESLGKKHGLKLVQPLPGELMEILSSKEGVEFARNVMFTDVEASIMADRTNRVNNGIVIEKAPNGKNSNRYFAYDIESVNVKNRKVPTKSILVYSDGKAASAAKEFDGVVEFYKLGKMLGSSPVTKPGNLEVSVPSEGYFKKDFPGTLPWIDDIKKWKELREMSECEESAYHGSWNLSDLAFLDGNIATLSSYYDNGSFPFSLSAFSMKPEKPTSRDTILNVMPIITRENPKK